MGDLVPFNFDDNVVRVVRDNDGEPWFVLRDLLDAMASSTTTTAAVESIKQGLGDGYVADIPVHDARGQLRDAIIVSAPASTYLLSRSNTAKGRKLNRFIHVEVLPAIRKTGGYRAKAPRRVDPVIASHRKAVAIGRTYMVLGKLFGTDEAMSRAIAADRIRAETDLDVTPLLAGNSVAEAPVTPTELGKVVGMTGRAVNALLQLRGYQIKDEHGEWRPTDRGKPYCTVNPYKSPSSDHTGYRILWYPSVLDLKREMAEAKEREAG